MQGTGRDPGVGCLDWTSFSLAAKATSAHLAHSSRLAGKTVYRVRCCANSSLRPWPQFRSSDQRSSSASVMKEIPSSRPVMWGRQASTRVSPLKSIDTMSVSTIAAFIAGRWDEFLRYATRGGARKTPPPIRPQVTAPRAEIRNRRWEKRPAEQPVPRMSARRRLAIRRSRPAVPCYSQIQNSSFKTVAWKSPPELVSVDVVSREESGSAPAVRRALSAGPMYVSSDQSRWATVRRTGVSGRDDSAPTSRIN